MLLQINDRQEILWSQVKNSLKAHYQERTKNRLEQLERLLADKNWEAADQVTELVIVNSTYTNNVHLLDGMPSWADVSCDHLRQIDQLWLKYSSNKFGLSVQRRIYLETGNILGETFYNEYFAYAHFSPEVLVDEAYRDDYEAFRDDYDDEDYAERFDDEDYSRLRSDFEAYSRFRSEVGWGNSGESWMAKNSIEQAPEGHFPKTPNKEYQSWPWPPQDFSAAEMIMFIRLERVPIGPYGLRPHDGVGRWLKSIASSCEL